MVECTAYDKLLIEGKMRDPNPALRPAGKSAAVIGEDSYPKTPSTPPHLRKYRVNTIPGEIVTHWGLKEQKLPNEEFRYGRTSDTGESVEQIFAKAAEITQGMAEYKNDRKEDIYISKKREPLGTSFIRGHVLPAKVYKDDFKGFGVSVEHPVDMAKNAIYPRNIEPDSKQIRERYRWTHGHYEPGEMIKRDYDWPEETKGTDFRFGITDRDDLCLDGDGAKGALSMDTEDDGSFKHTVIVQKNLQDFQDRDHDCIGKTHNMVYEYPPVPVNFSFGKASGKRIVTAELCMKGARTEKELAPDPDLGKCIKVGRRNFTDGPRAYGTPSVRSDIPAPPPEKRSLADVQNYGDEAGTGPLLNPDKYQAMNVSEDVFLLRREKSELRSILQSAGYEYDDETYEDLWTRATKLFEDELNLASVDSLLYVTRQEVAANVARSRQNGETLEEQDHKGDENTEENREVAAPN